MRKKRTKLEVSHSLTPDYTTKLQYENGMILAEKQTPISMDMNRDKIESPEINQGIYGQLIYNKGVKNMQW